MKNFIVRAFIFLAIVVIAFILFFAGFRVIEDGYMGVEVAAIGKHRVMPEPLPSGWYWRRPLMIRIFPYNMREQSFSFSDKNATTADKRIVSLEFSLYYQWNPEKLVDLHKRFEDAYNVRQKLENFAEALLSGIVKEYTREQLFGASRDVMIKSLQEKLTAEFQPIGININNLVLNRLDFPEKYTEDIAKYYPAYTTMTAIKKQFYTRDKKRLTLSLQIYYHIEPRDAEYVHNHLGTGYLKGYILPKVQSIADQMIVQEDMDTIYSGSTRDQVTKKILEETRKQMSDYKVKIDDIAVESIEFDPEYQKILDEIQRTQKQIEQLNITAKLEEKKSEIEMKKRMKEQEIKVREAESEKSAELIRAEGIKRAEILKAEGKAESLLKVQKIIAENPNILRFLYIDKISDKVQVMVVPSGDSGLWWPDAVKTIKNKGE